MDSHYIVSSHRPELRSIIIGIRCECKITLPVFASTGLTVGGRANLASNGRSPYIEVRPIYTCMKDS